MIKVFVVDDEPLARMRVKQLLMDYPGEVELIGEADTGKTALEQIDLLKPQAIFLDIQLPDFSGFEVLKQLSYKPLVVFTTAYQEYAIEAFETLSVDYLVKPLMPDRFKIAIEKLKMFSNSTSFPDIKALQTLLDSKSRKKISSLPVKKKDRIILVDLEDIAYLKAEDKYVLVVLQNGKTHLVNKTISQLEEELPEAFFRAHRSYIVNKEFVFEIEKHFKGNLILKLKDVEQSAILTGASFTPRVRALFSL